MISLEDVRNLASLARLKLAPGEEEALQKDISSILDYVGQVSAASAPTPEVPALRNVLREDTPGQTLGVRDELVAAFPTREGDYNVVRKILPKDE